MATFRYGYTLTWPGTGGPGRAIWHFRQDGIGLTSVQDCVDAIDNWYAAVWAANVIACPCTATGDSEAVDVVTQEITPVDGGYHNQPTAAVEFNPSAMLIATMRTSSATKSGLGRKFIGPIRSSVTHTDGRPDNGNLVTLQAACNALVTASEGMDGAAIGVYSPTQSLFRDLTVMTMRNYIAVLRSRRD